MSELRQQLSDLGADITTALEDVGLPAALLDTDGVVRWQNRASLERRGDVVGSDLVSLVAPEEVAAAKDVLVRILCRGEPAELTLHVPLATGGFEAREISAAPVREGGSVVGVFGLSAPALTRADSRRKAGELAARLTDRQLDVLRLLAEGKSTHQIASELSLSTTTVRNYVANLLSALGVHTRLQAVVAASKAGLIDL